MGVILLCGVTKRNIYGPTLLCLYVAIIAIINFRITFRMFMAMMHLCNVSLAISKYWILHIKKKDSLHAFMRVQGVSFIEED